MNCRRRRCRIRRCPAAWKASGGAAVAGGGPMACIVRRSGADCTRHGGVSVQRRPAGDGGARRAGRRLREGGERRAVAVGGRRGHERRQVGRQRRPRRDLAQRVAGARRLGPPALRACGRGGTGRGVRRRLRVRSPVAGGNGRQELVPGDRGRAAARDCAGGGALCGRVAARRAGPVARRQRQRAGGGGGARERRHLP